MSDILWKIKASKGYHKTLLIVCTISVVIGIVSVVMGMEWGVLQIVISGGIGISAYLRMKTAEEISKNPDAYVKQDIFGSFREAKSEEDFKEFSDDFMREAMKRKEDVAEK